MLLHSFIFMKLILNTSNEIFYGKLYRSTFKHIHSHFRCVTAIISLLIHCHRNILSSVYSVERKINKLREWLSCSGVRIPLGKPAFSITVCGFKSHFRLTFPSPVNGHPGDNGHWLTSVRLHHSHQKPGSSSRFLASPGLVPVVVHICTRTSECSLSPDPCHYLPLCLYLPFK